MRAVVINAFGGTENLAVVELPDPEPLPGHVVVRVEAAGLNFLDVLRRRGEFIDGLELPVPAGSEGAGVVVAVGARTPGLTVGDRVVWPSIPGSHAELVSVPATHAVPLPAWLDSTDAAALFSQGLTAQYLAHSLHGFRADDTALVWAAAGGVGRLLTQMLAVQGVRVIAAASTEAKRQMARASGAEVAVAYDEVLAAVDEFTKGVGVDVVLDGVGAPTFEDSLTSVRRRGMVVVYGGSGGQTPPVDLIRLSAAGSVRLVRPRFIDFHATPDELAERANELFATISRGEITVQIAGAYPLSEVAAAHQALESREAAGKVILLPA